MEKGSRVDHFLSRRMAVAQQIRDGDGARRILIQPWRHFSPSALRAGSELARGAPSGRLSSPFFYTVIARGGVEWTAERSGPAVLTYGVAIAPLLPSVSAGTADTVRTQRWQSRRSVQKGTIDDQGTSRRHDQREPSSVDRRGRGR